MVCGFEFLSLTDKIQHIFGSRKCYFIPLALQEKKERTQKITIQCNKTNQRKSRYCCRSAQLFCKVALCFSHATVDSSVIKNYTSTCSFFPLKKKNVLQTNRNKCEPRFDGTLPHQLVGKIYRRSPLTYSRGDLTDLFQGWSHQQGRHQLRHKANVAHRSATGLGNSESHMKCPRTAA